MQKALTLSTTMSIALLYLTSLLPTLSTATPVGAISIASSASPLLRPRIPAPAPELPPGITPWFPPPSLDTPNKYRFSFSDSSPRLTPSFLAQLSSEINAKAQAAGQDAQLGFATKEAAKAKVPGWDPAVARKNEQKEEGPPPAVSAEKKAMGYGCVAAERNPNRHICFSPGQVPLPSWQSESTTATGSGEGYSLEIESTYGRYDMHGVPEDPTRWGQGGMQRVIADLEAYAQTDEGRKLAPYISSVAVSQFGPGPNQTRKLCDLQFVKSQAAGQSSASGGPSAVGSGASVGAVAGSSTGGDAAWNVLDSSA